MINSPTLPGRRYGWRPSLHDPRDLQADLAYDKTFPLEASLRAQMPAIYDQEALGSCTANSVAACVEFYFAQHFEDFMPSRLWIYYWERYFEHLLGQGDTGAYGRDGFKVAHRMGCPPEADWPYDISRFEDTPPSKAADDAPQRKIPSYKAVRRRSSDLRAAIMYGQPVAYGFSVPASFEQIGPDGIWHPGEAEQIIGGHEVVLIGFKVMNGELYAEVRNSWGEGWGDKGHFWVPMKFLTGGQCGDFRTIHHY